MNERQRYNSSLKKELIQTAKPVGILFAAMFGVAILSSIVAECSIKPTPTPRPEHSPILISRD